jgi:hypothetical protein
MFGMIELMLLPLILLVSIPVGLAMLALWYLMPRKTSPAPGFESLPMQPWKRTAA